MKFELKTYKPDKNTVSKTYRTDRIKLKFGTIRKLLKDIPIDEIDLNDNQALVVFMLKKWEHIVPIFLDIFRGMTEAELDTCEIDEMADVVRGIFAYASEEFGKLGSGKN
jgi:hypothetical protein